MGLRIQNIIIALLASIFGASGAQASLNKSGLNENKNLKNIAKDLKLSASEEVKLQEIAQAGNVFEIDQFFREYSSKTGISKPRRIRKIRRGTKKTTNKKTRPNNTVPKSSKFGKVY